MSLEKFEKYIFLAPASPAPKRCVLRTFQKTFSWKSKMKPVVKYGVYWDILLRVPIYVTKCRLFKEKSKITRFARLLLTRRSVWIFGLCFDCLI